VTAVPLGPAPGPIAALAAVYRGQVSRAKAARGPLLFVATLQSVGILLLLRGVVDEGNRTTSQQVVAGATVLVVAFVALNLLAQRFGLLRGAGALDHYAALPVPGAAVVLGTAASYATFTVPGAVVTAIGGSLLYGLPLAHLWVLVLVLPLAGASLAGLGALLGLLAPRPELATVAGQLGMSAILFLGIIPDNRLPGVIRLVRAVVPSTYATDALASSYAPHLDAGLLVRDLVVCAAVAVLSLLLASVGTPVTGPSGRSRQDLRAFAIVAVALALLGAPVGLLWSAVAPRLTVVLRPGQDPAAQGIEGKAFIAADGYFLVIVLVTGLLTGLLAWQFFRRNGPFTVLGLLVGGLLAAKLAAVVGVRPRAHEALAALHDPAGRGPVQLYLGKMAKDGSIAIRSGWAVVGWPVGAMLAFLGRTLIHPDDVDDTIDPEPSVVGGE